MTDEPRPHEAEFLLPLYIDGTLVGEECRQVETHLVSCADCRRELEIVRRLRHEVALAVASRVEGSPKLASRVRASIAAREAVEASRRGETSTPWWERFADRIFHLVPSRLAPALALVVIVLQFAGLAAMGAILYQTLERSTFTTATIPVSNRSGPEGSVRVRAMFQETASERDIRSALQAIHGRIVEGPTAAGVYVIETPAGTAPQTIVEALLHTPQVVRYAEPLTP